MLEKYWQFERKVQKILIELCNLKLLDSIFFPVGIGILVLWYIKVNMLVSLMFFVWLLFYYIKEEYIFTSLKGFFKGSILVILVISAVFIKIDEIINVSGDIKYIIYFCIVCIMWSMYSSFCNIDISTLGNAVFTGSVCIFDKIINMKFIEDFIVRIASFEIFQAFLNEADILLSLLFIILSIATIICALKKYWLNKYHPKEGDIMNISQKNKLRKY